MALGNLTLPQGSPVGLVRCRVLPAALRQHAPNSSVMGPALKALFHMAAPPASARMLVARVVPCLLEVLQRRNLDPCVVATALGALGLLANQDGTPIRCPQRIPPPRCLA